jgi:hypothetical protein
VPDIYVRHLERIYEGFSDSMKRDSRYISRAHSMEKQLALDKWCQKIQRRNVGEFFAPQNNVNWPGLKCEWMQKRAQENEEFEAELRGKVETAMEYENAVGRNGEKSCLGWKLEDWRDIQRQIREEKREEWMIKMKRSTSVSTVASSAYNSVFDDENYSGEDEDEEDDDDFDHLYAFEDPPMAKDGCAKEEESSAGGADFVIEFAHDPTDAIGPTDPYSSDEDETSNSEDEDEDNDEDQNEGERIKDYKAPENLTYGETFGRQAADHQDLSLGQYRKMCFLTSLRKVRQDIMNEMWSM